MVITAKVAEQYDETEDRQRKIGMPSLILASDSESFFSACQR